MPTCKDCLYYSPIDETRGNCFGHPVPPDRDADECPAQAFQQKEENERDEQ